jgi:hypothetical protein
LFTNITPCSIQGNRPREQIAARAFIGLDSLAGWGYKFEICAGLLKWTAKDLKTLSLTVSSKRSHVGDPVRVIKMEVGSYGFG